MNRLVKILLILVILATLGNLVSQVILWAPPVSDNDSAIGGGAGEEITPPAIDIELSMAVIPDADGKVPEGGVSASDDKATVEIPAGVQLEEGATSLKLTVDGIEESEADVDLSEDEVKNSLDVHIEGVAKNNTIPMEIKIFAAAVKGLNSPSIRLFHVENGETVEMSRVAIGDSFTAHNQFKYDPATGDVTLYMATFSEVALVNNTVNHWEGKFDYSWYDASKTELIIANAEQLAAFGGIVGGMKVVVSTENGVHTYSDEVIQDSFKGKTVKLVADISIGDTNEFYDDASENGIVLYPIGYWNNEGTYERLPVDQRVNAVESGFYSFEGTFDGNNHTISDWHHNTWEMKGDHNWYNAVTEQYYRDGMGLFGKVYGGTVKNLIVKNFSSDGEITTTGVIAAYADGATFENIAIFNCNPRVYNIGNGGIVGCVGWYAKEAGMTTTFKNITVDNSNKISALWGSYDVACGGIVGQYYPTSGQSSYDYPVNGGIVMEKCHVAAQLDVYNDVCGNYMYYAYRYAGMLIGSVRENETGADGHVYPKMDGITFSECTVHYGQWNHYYYCEFEKNGHPSYAAADEYKFSRVPESELVRDAEGNVTGCTHDHTDVEDNRAVYLPFADQIVTGYGWGVTSKGIADVKGVTTLDRVEGDSQVKFDPNPEANEGYKTGTTITIGELFMAATLADPNLRILPYQLHVAVSPANVDSTAGATFVPNTEDWTKGTLTFTGSGIANVIITDYFFCISTTIQVKVADYVVQYINNGEVLYTAYMNSSEEYKVLVKGESDFDAIQTKIQNQKGMDNTYIVNYWMNVGSTKVETIPAGTLEDVKLYPSFKNRYTATIVDQDGKVLTWTIFTADNNGKNTVVSKANSVTPPDKTDMKFHGEWQVQVTNDAGEITKKQPLTGTNAFDFTKCTTDITLYPIYTFDGDVNLVPVDTDGDGQPNYYEVGGYSNATGQDVVEIPDTVNGANITTIYANAFSGYPGVHVVVLPRYIEIVGDNAISDASTSGLFGIGIGGETVTLYYSGSKSEWLEREKNFDSKWDFGLGESSIIYFLNGGDKVDPGEGYLKAKHNKSSGITVSITSIDWIENTIDQAYINDMYTKPCSGCDSDHSDIGGKRPDYIYWGEEDGSAAITIPTT